MFGKGKYGSVARTPADISDRDFSKNTKLLLAVN